MRLFLLLLVTTMKHYDYHIDQGMYAFVATGFRIQRLQLPDLVTGVWLSGIRAAMSGLRLRAGFEKPPVMRSEA